MFSIPSTTDKSWHNFLSNQFTQPYMQQLFQLLSQQEQQGITIYPSTPQWFRVFELPIDKIKLTIIGQDPYFNEGQAMGLSFSVPPNMKIPPSLKNIFKEIESDLAIKTGNHGNLSRWANEEGIFLLNASLTVESGNPGSHLKKGWQTFTLAVLEHINQQCQATVFLAWGAFAHKSCSKIDIERHCVIKTSHPSPLGAYKTMKTAPAFLGSRCFSQANDYLQRQNKKTISWAVD